jgi:hypothetical protein
MRVRARHSLFITLTALAASAAQAARDPFLPIDYAPPAPKVVKPDNVAPAPQPPPPPIAKTITDADWAEARKAVKISGFTKSVNPSTGVTVVQAMINRQPYAAGEEVIFVHDGIRFQWRVAAITETEVSLTPLKADRLASTPAAAVNAQ